MPLVPTPSPWPTHHPVRALRKSFPLCRYIYIEKNANMSSQSKFCDKNQPDQQLGIYYAAVVPSECRQIAHAFDLPRLPVDARHGVVARPLVD